MKESHSLTNYLHTSLCLRVCSQKSPGLENPLRRKSFTSCFPPPLPFPSFTSFRFLPVVLWGWGMWSISSHLVTMRKKSRKSVKSWSRVLIVVSHWTKPGMIYLKYFCLREKWSEVKWSESRSVMSDSLLPHGLYSPWTSPGQNPAVGSLSFLQGIFPTQGLNPGLLHCRQILYQLSHKGNYNCWNHIWLNIIGTCSRKYFNTESIFLEMNK